MVAELGSVAVWPRDCLSVAQPLAGPAIITDADATTFIDPGWTGTLNENGHLVLTAAQTA
jgi:N-methylhydantoinase A/oxoprolinase/acetone carboxylase beta subunit